MDPTTSTGVNPAIFDLADGLNPTSPLITDVGTLVISLAARTAKRLADPRSKGAIAAFASWSRKITAIASPMINLPAWKAWFLFTDWFFIISGFVFDGCQSKRE